MQNPAAMRWITLALAVLSACFYETTGPLPADFATCELPPGVPPVAPPTWFGDVQPIVVGACVECHQPGGIGPFSLTTLGSFIPVRDRVRDQVASGAMPPWQPSPCCGTYLHERRLAPDDVATLIAWLDAGLPAGDPGTAAPLPPVPGGLPRIDLTAAMAEPYTPVPQVGVDEVRCFLLDHAPIASKSYMTGFEFHPGRRAMVHHVIIYAVEPGELAERVARDGKDGRPGWDCYGDAGELASGTSFVAGWQPGNQARLLPDGNGRPIAAGSRLVASIHYDTGHELGPDLSTLDMTLEAKVAKEEKSIGVANPIWFAGDSMLIRAGDPDASVWFAFDPTVLTGGTIELTGVMLHMHELGSRGRLAILRADGTTECLLEIPAWDFHWLGDYVFAAPVPLAPGDRLYLECHWDNTQANQKVVQGELEPPRDVRWGLDEEMCGGIVTYAAAVGS